MNGFIFAIGAAIVWGLAYAIDQKILNGTSPITLLFIDSLITAIFMLPFLFSHQISIKNLLSSGRSNLSLIIISLVLAGLGNFLIFSGIKSVGASSASIIEIAYPLFVALFSIIIFRLYPSVSFQ